MATHLKAADIATLLANSLTVGAGTTVTGATNANPIVITSVAHGLVTGDVAYVDSVGGNTNADGVYKVEKVDVDTVKLLGRAGNSAFTTGGTIKKVSFGKLANDLKPSDVENLLDALRRLKHVRMPDYKVGVGESNLGSIFTGQQP